MKTFSHAEFVASAGRLADFPPPGPRELAFAGRSNVGKSSAINALVGRKRLAYTSKTPGRTQTINFYELGGGARLVDFPGYGFAKVPRPLRVQFEQLVGDYLGSGRALAGGWSSWTRYLGPPTASSRLARRHARCCCSCQGRQAQPRRTGRGPRTVVSAGPRAPLRASRTRRRDCRKLLQQWVAADRENKKPPAKGN